MTILWLFAVCLTTENALVSAKSHGGGGASGGMATMATMADPVMIVVLKLVKSMLEPQ